MKTSVPRLIALSLTITFSVLMMENAFPQTDQKGIEAVRGKNDSTNTYVTGLTSDRARSLVGVAMGLISVIIGWRMKTRHVVNGGSRSWAVAALVAGITAVVLSIVHLANVTGGFGTGGGKAGAIAALVLGLIGTSHGALSFRSKRNH